MKELSAWRKKWNEEKADKIAKKIAANPKWKPRKKVRNPELNAFNEYRTTTNSSVYRKLHKHHHAYCSYCKWHGGGMNENDRWESYWYDIEGHSKKGKFPSWKLVSTNKKQWMQKPLYISEPRWRSIMGLDTFCEITWPMKIRPK